MRGSAFNPPLLILIGLVRAYRWGVSPFIIPSCRFAPSLFRVRPGSTDSIRSPARRIPGGAEDFAVPPMGRYRIRPGSRVIPSDASVLSKIGQP